MVALPELRRSSHDPGDPGQGPPAGEGIGPELQAISIRVAAEGGVVQQLDHRAGAAHGRVLREAGVRASAFAVGDDGVVDLSSLHSAGGSIQDVLVQAVGQGVAVGVGPEAGEADRHERPGRHSVPRPDGERAQPGPLAALGCHREASLLGRRTHASSSATTTPAVRRTTTVPPVVVAEARDRIGRPGRASEIARARRAGPSGGRPAGGVDRQLPKDRWWGATWRCRWRRP